MIAPSKKVISIFILVVALVIAIIITFGKDKSSTAINFASNLVVGDKFSVPENTNWQSELKNINQYDIETPQEETPTTPDTLTDTVSMSLMSNYLALKESGTLDQTSAQKLIDQTINYVGEGGIAQITESQLKIIPDNGRQTVADYGENLGNILKNNKPSSNKSEIEIIKEIMEKKDPQKIEELQEAIETYKKISIEIRKMTIPKTFVEAHVDMTNGMLSLVAGLEEIKKVFVDPVRALQGLKLYQDGGSLFIQAIQASSKFISQNNIIYKQGSGGYYLLYGI